MSVPAVGISVTCDFQCTQCCPNKLRIFCCCCKVDSDEQADRPPLKHRVSKKRHKKKHPKVKPEEKDDGRTQYVCVHRSEENRTAAVAIAVAEASKEPEKPPPLVRCTIL